MTTQLATPLRAEPLKDQPEIADLFTADDKWLGTVPTCNAALIVGMSEQNKRMREALELLNLTATHSHDCTEAKCHTGCEYRIISAALGREGRV